MTGRLYSLLFPVPVVCFVAAWVADIAYSATAELQWLHFSEWLIAAGLAFGALAALVLLVEILASRPLRNDVPGWAHLALFYAGLAIEVFSALVHTVDGWTAVVPTGMTLSTIGVILVLAAAALLPRLRPAWTVREEVLP